MTPALLIAGIPWWIFLAGAVWGAGWALWLYRLDRRDARRDRERGAARGETLAGLAFLSLILVCGFALGASCATDDDVRDALDLPRCGR